MKESVRIDFLRFHEVFELLVDDSNTNNGNRAAFGLLDIRDKGQLDVMIILSLLNNLDRDSLFAQELILLLRHHKQKNVLTPGAHRRPVVLNVAAFNDIIPRSCLVDELQYVFCGDYLPKKVSNKTQAQVSNFLSSFLAKELLSDRRLAQRAVERKHEEEQEPNPRPNDSRLQLPGESAEEALVRLRANPDHAPPLTVQPPAQKPFEHIETLIANSQLRGIGSSSQQSETQRVLLAQSTC